MKLNIQPGILALLALVALCPERLWAQEPAASCLCNAKEGTLVIRYTPDLDGAKPPWPDKPVPVKFMALLVLDKDETTVVDTRSKTFSCALKTDRFEIILEPAVSNPNLLGRCGDAVTGAVTVKRNGAVVLSQQEFEAANCHERERMLQQITFTNGSSKPDLQYVGYGD